MPTVFLSEATGEARLPFPAVPPTPDPVFGPLAAAYRDGLRASGLAVRAVVRPEIYHTEAARRLVGAGEADWHLAVKPVADLRPFHGLRNVFVCAWPFAETPAMPAGASPFGDPGHVLRQADAVLCLTETAAAALAGAALPPVLVLPPPVPEAPARLGRASEPSGVVSVVTTPGPALARVIAGVRAARAVRPELRLVVCDPGRASEPRGSAGEAEPRRSAGETEPRRSAGETEPGVVRTGHTLADVLASAHAFVASDPPGAFSLPLAQALRLGCPSLAPAGAVPGDAASGVIALDTEAVLADPAWAPLARDRPLTVELPRPGSIRDAVLRVAALAPGERADLGAAARAWAADRHGQERFADGLVALRRVIGR